jgi:uncharacterized protein (UPF0261 family)
MSRVYAVATMDTKGAEIAFVAERIRACGVEVVTVDVGTRDAAVVAPDISREQVAACCSTTNPLTKTDRGEAVTAMSAALVEFLKAEYAAGKLAGVIGIGGGGGTALTTPAMRALPVGVPKLMVSTMASGNVGPYVDCSDITMMYSVVDVAGINSVSRRVLANAAHAIAGMVQHPLPSVAEKPTVGMTMFGVTTPCVDAVRKTLESRGYDCLVFHATGSGDRAMENLVRSGLIQGVIDVTTTAVADEVVGGVLACGPHRFDAILEARIPYVLSVGALDMVNFGAKETVPPKFADRKLHVHNAQVTLMRTTPDENRRCARWIASKLNHSTAPLTLMIPEHGVSAIDVDGQPFHDPAANAALFDEVVWSIEPRDHRVVKRLPFHINDPEFAEALVDEFEALNAVATISEVLAHSASVDQSFQKTMDFLLCALPHAQEIGILLWDKARNELLLKATKWRQLISTGDKIHINQWIVRSVFQTGEGFRTSQPAKPEELPLMRQSLASTPDRLQVEVLEGSPLRGGHQRGINWPYSVICARIESSRLGRLGVIELWTENLSLPFRNADLDLLTRVAIEVGSALEKFAPPNHTESGK